MADANHSSSLSAHTPAGTKQNGQQITSVDDEADSHIRAPRAALAPGGDADTMKSAGANTLSEIGGQQDTARLETNMQVREDRLLHFQQRAERDKQADDSQDGSRNNKDGAKRVLDASATPTRPPRSRPEPRSTAPIESSSSFQLNREDCSSSPRLSWTLIASASISRPSSSNRIVNLGSSSLTNLPADETSVRNEDLYSLLYDPGKFSPSNSETKWQSDETTSQAEGHECHELGETDPDFSITTELRELEESIVDISNEDIVDLEQEVGCSSPGHVDLLNVDDYLPDQLHGAHELFQYLQEEVMALREDIDHLCAAWLRACVAASVNADAIARFQFLITDSDVDTDGRAAAHDHLETNELCCRISDVQTENLGLRLDSDSKDEVIAAYREAPGPPHETSVDDTKSQRGPADWQKLYRQKQQCFESLQSQYRQLKIEAERMYWPGLEGLYRDLKAELIETQDHNASLADDARKAREQAQAWKIEVEQYKEQLLHHSMQTEEQSRRQNEELSAVIKEYQGKFDDSKMWDKDGLIVENRRLEHEQVMFDDELSRLLRASASKDDEIARLVERHQQDNKTIRELRRAWSIGDAAALLANSTEQKRSAHRIMTDLREQQKQRREGEDAKEVLKDKVRQLQVNNLDLNITERWAYLSQTEWRTRWKVDECLENLNAVEKALLKQMEAAVQGSPKSSWPGC